MRKREAKLGTKVWDKDFLFIGKITELYTEEGYLGQPIEMMTITWTHKSDNTDFNAKEHVPVHGTYYYRKVTDNDIALLALAGKIYAHK